MTYEIPTPQGEFAGDGAGDGSPIVELENAAPIVETLDEAIARLAMLRPLEYDRRRKDEAKRLNVRPITLDAEVRKARGENEEGGDSAFDDVDPWPDPVDTGTLLSELAGTIRRFVVCDTETVAASALWCAATWLVDVVGVCPILLINAPERACGKTQLLTVVGKLVRRPAQSSGITSSALFRLVEKYQPTLLVDEIETVLTKEAEDLRGLLNAGHTRESAFVWRSVAVRDDFEPRRFAVFGFKALAGINAIGLAETITSRAVVAQLRRKMPHETAERPRYAEPDLFDTLQSKLTRWADDNRGAIRAARPKLPDALGDRDQDNWEPLLAIADLAGEKWAAYARTAALKLCGQAAEAGQSAGAELLADIRDVFEGKKASRISMADLLAALLDDEEKPWATWRGGKPMTTRNLGTMLGKYGIKSKSIKISYQVSKGFEIEQFKDAFDRYLNNSADTPLGPVTQLLSNAGAGFEVTGEKKVTVTQNSPVTTKPAPNKAGNRVTDERGVSTEKKEVALSDLEGEVF